MEIKRIVKCVVLFLICLCIGNSPYVKAGNVDEQLLTNEEPITKILDASSKEVTVVQPFYYVKESELKNSKANGYRFKVEKGYESEYFIPVKIKQKGVLLYNIVAKNQSATSKVKYALYNDKEKNIKIPTSKNRAFINAPGTYYICISKASILKDADSEFSGIFAFVSGTGVQLKNKIKVVSAVLDDNASIYYKVRVDENSELSFEVTSDSEGTVTLCDSKKAKLSGMTKFKISGNAVYAVKKGTYYIKVSAKKGFITAQINITKASKDSGKNIKNAGILKFKKKAKQVSILVQDKNNTEYWFKFENKKNQKVCVDIQSSFTSGKLDVEILSAEQKSLGVKTLDKGISQTKRLKLHSTFLSNDTLAKGTYYIKIIKKDKKATGNVTIKVGD